MVTKKPAGTAVVSWAEKLASFAQEAAAEEKPASGTAITCRAGQLSVAGNPVAGNKLSVVVVGSLYENAYYTSDYDPDNPQPPSCFAFSAKEAELVPHEASADIQHPQCKGCQWNEFGSAAKGKGKACKNIRRLAIMSASPLTAEALQEGEMAYMKLPVTSGPAWGQYVKMLEAVHKRPPFAVITEIGAVPDPKTQFKITFAYKGNIDDGEVLGILETKHEAAYEFLAVPYQAAAEEEKVVPKKPAPKARGKF